MARKKASQARKGHKKKAQHHAHTEGGGCGGESGATSCSTEQENNSHPIRHGSSGSQNAGGGGGSGSGAKGPVPNLFWGHVSDAQLRRMERYVGLPPTRSILPMWDTEASR